MTKSFCPIDARAGRIEYIDIFRAFGIILMVMGHIGFGNRFDVFIHSFHMPMFFVASGFLFKGSNIKFQTFLIKKAKSLLLPFLLFAAFNYFVAVFFFRDYFNGFLGILYPDIVQIPISGAVWFLIALFFANIIYFFICKINNERIKWIAVIVLASIGQIVPSLCKISLPFCLSSALVGVGLMHIGKTIYSREKYITGLEIYQIVFFSICLLFLIQKGGYVDMRQIIYPKIYLVFWINAVGASVIIMNISKRINNLLKSGFIGKYIKSIGRNSITYLCLNQIVIKASDIFLVRLIGPFLESTIYLYIFKISSFILSMILLFLTSLMFEKTFLRILIGKFNLKKT